MKLYTLLLATCFLLPLQGENPTVQSFKPLVSLKKSSPTDTLTLVKYFGLTTASSYGFLYLINKNAGAPVSQKQLASYALGIPSLIGFGLYLGVVAGFKPCSSLIT